VTIGGVKRLAVASTTKRLAALEQQFIEIAKMTKGLRRYLDEVAETVRIAVEELRANRTTRRRTVPGNRPSMRRGGSQSRPRATDRTV
jgi:hypothetical protein